MKTSTLVTIVCMLIGFGAHSQTRVTKNTKIVLVVSQKSERVIVMELFGNFQKMKKEVIRKIYPDCRFYIGLLKGSYDLNKKSIAPSKGTTVTMYTSKQFFPGDNFFPGDHFSPGDNFTLGKTKAKVISTKKGELVLRIK